jgi:dolichol-phosphate mannosyltransferase
MRDIVLLPTYNERENIQIVVPDIFKLYPSIHIMVIDDNSPDKTAEVVKSMMDKYPNLSIMERAEKTGLRDAYFSAFRKLRNDSSVRSVITMDADGSHLPKYLQNFLDNIDKYDLLVGSRYVKGGGVHNWELWRKLLSKYGNLYAKILSGMKIGDVTAGFMCLKRELIEQVNLENIEAGGYSFLIETKFHLLRVPNTRVKEIPIVFHERMEGVTKFSRKILIEGLITPWRLLFLRLGFSKNLDSGKESWEKSWKKQSSSFNVISIGRKVYNYFLYRFLKKYLQKDINFLEFGCGTASLGLALSKEIRSYTGYDIADNALEEARKIFKGNNVKNYHFKNQNILNLANDEKCDIVWSQGLIEHFDLEMIPALIDAHLRMCKKDGYAIISVPAKYSYHHLWHFLTRPGMLRRFWPWPDQNFISKKNFVESMEKLSTRYNSYKVTHIKPFVLGLTILVIRK